MLPDIIKLRRNPVDPFSGSTNLPLSAYDYARHYGNASLNQGKKFTEEEIREKENARRGTNFYPGNVIGSHIFINPLDPLEYVAIYNRKNVHEINALELQRIKYLLLQILQHYKENMQIMAWVSNYCANIESFLSITCNCALKPLFICLVHNNNFIKQHKTPLIGGHIKQKASQSFGKLNRVCPF